MTGSVIIDIIIGLIFVYLLYSLFASIIQEGLASLLSFRAKLLEKAIVRMLEDGKTNTSSNWFISRIQALSWLFSSKNNIENKYIAAAFYNHPLIKYLAEDNTHNKPAYISKENFSKVMIELLTGIGVSGPDNLAAGIDGAIRKGKIKDFLTIYEISEDHPVAAVQKRILDNGTAVLSHSSNSQEHYEAAMLAVDASASYLNINPETRLFLQSIWDEAQKDSTRFKTLLEKWFDDTMERAGGWYKRHVQLLLFVIGLLMAIIFNVDTITIARKLARDPKLREQMVQNAASFVEQHKDLDVQMASKQSRIDSLAMAQKQVVFKEQAAKLINEADTLLQKDINSMNQLLGLGWSEGFCAGANGLSLLGWIITALAISLGAPFWFDMLNKIMKLRGTGTKIVADTSQKNVVDDDQNSADKGQTQPVTVNINSQTGEEAVG